MYTCNFWWLLLLLAKTFVKVLRNKQGLGIEKLLEEKFT